VMRERQAKFRIERNMAWGGLRMWFLVKDENSGLLSVGEDIVMRTLAENECAAEPTIHMTDEMACQLMDELWLTGVRPSSGEGSTGKIAAVERHLEDMRSIVASELGVKL
jgi:hypothetical protein